MQLFGGGQARCARRAAGLRGFVCVCVTTQIERATLTILLLHEAGQTG